MDRQALWTFPASTGRVPGRIPPNFDEKDSVASKPPHAVRGNRVLNQDELRAHLIQVFRLENVGVLLGAGASKGAGGLLVSELWNHFATTAPNDVQWCKRHKFLPDDFPASPPNIEKFSDTLADAEKEWERLRTSASSPKKRWPDLEGLHGAMRAVRRSVVHAARLDDSLWDLPSGQAARDRLADHRRLLTRVVASRQPGQSSSTVFTVNYDLALEWAAETLGIEPKTGFQGVHRRRFSPQTFDLVPRNALARGEASLGSYAVSIVKLHGSLTWRVEEETGDLIEHPAGHLDQSFRDFISGKAADLPTHMIYPSSAKYRQTIQFVFGELFRRFNEFLARPQAALFVCGYSFCDDHLNRIILAGLLNPTLQVIIYYREMEDQNGALVLKDSAPTQLKSLFDLRLPRVTFVGGGDAANFSSMTEDFPDPATTDGPAEEAQALLRLARRAVHPSPPPPDGKP